MATAARPWHLYLLRCRNGALYAGIATCVTTRLAQHAAGRGAKYTRSNPPVALIGSVSYSNRAEASRAEHAIRQLRPAQKIEFIAAEQRRPRAQRRAAKPAP